MIKIMTFNVHGTEENIPGPQSEWNMRKKPISELIINHDIDLLGLQEPFYEQTIDLEKMLPDYLWYGIGLEDADKKGPMNIIFYKKNKFDVLDKGFFYLSQTPDIPSKCWGARFNRGVVWLKLVEKEQKATFYFFNTHFDYHSRIARDESSQFLVKQINQIANDFPLILLGDFNFFPDLGGYDTYKLLTYKDDKQWLFNAQNVSSTPHMGPVGSWSGFKEAGQPGIKPDFIFVNNKVRVLSHRILADTDKGKFLSDHLPLISDIEIQA